MLGSADSSHLSAGIFPDEIDFAFLDCGGRQARSYHHGLHSSPSQAPNDPLLYLVRHIFLPLAPFFKPFCCMKDHTLATDSHLWSRGRTREQTGERDHDWGKSLQSRIDNSWQGLSVCGGIGPGTTWTHGAGRGGQVWYEWKKDVGVNERNTLSYLSVSPKGCFNSAYFSAHSPS